LKGQEIGPTCPTNVLAAYHQGTVALPADWGMVTTPILLKVLLGPADFPLSDVIISNSLAFPETWQQ
jgi:hypothetical protein